MSESFDSGLRDLYLAAGAAHDARPGLAVDLVLARTRRARRARGAAVTVAAAAVVVGGALAGAAAVRGLGGIDGSVVPPATTPTPTATTPATGGVTAPACGDALADLARIDADDVRLDAGLEPGATVEDALPVRVTTTVLTADPLPTVEASVPTGYAFVVAQDGVVVATATWTPEPDLSTARDHGHVLAVHVVPCGGGELAPGDYELVAYLPAEVEVDGERVAGLLVAPSVPFSVAVPEAQAPPLHPGEDRVGADGVSDLPPADRSAPLPDGAYLALVTGVDAAAGTLDADLLVWYSGQAAQDWAAVHVPDGQAYDGYAVDDPDGPEPWRLPVLAEAVVWEWCSSEEGTEVVRRPGGVPEWAAAAEVGTRTCADGAPLPRTGYYWLDVRDGVVTQLVAQFVP